jgi:hypothetical protein
MYGDVTQETEMYGDVTQETEMYGDVTQETEMLRMEHKMQTGGTALPKE